MTGLDFLNLVLSSNDCQTNLDSAGKVSSAVHWLLFPLHLLAAAASWILRAGTRWWCRLRNRQLTAAVGIRAFIHFALFECHVSTSSYMIYGQSGHEGHCSGIFAKLGHALSSRSTNETGNTAKIRRIQFTSFPALPLKGVLRSDNRFRSDSVVDTGPDRAIVVGVVAIEPGVRSRG